MKKKNSILQNISANLFIQLITYLFSFLTVIYIARALQPALYGKASFAATFTGYFVMIANLGMPIYAMRLCAEKRDDRERLSCAVNELWSIGMLLSLVSIVLLVILTVTVPKLWKERALIVIYGSGIILQAFGFDWLFKGLERFRFLAVCQLCCKIIAFVCMLLFVRSGGNIILYAAFSLITSYGSNVICLLEARKVVDLSFRIKIVWSHMKPLFVFFLMSCAVTIYSSLDLTMLGFMKSDTETGLYTIASKAKSYLTILGGVVWTSILPRATALWKDGCKKEFESLACKSLTIVFGIQLVLTCICMVFARSVMVVLGGESYAGAETAFRILLLSLVPIGVSNILGGQVLIPAGQEKCLLRAEIVGAVVNFVANLIVIPRYSMEGAAATTVASEVIVALLCLYYAKSRLDMDFFLGLIRKVIRKVKRKCSLAVMRLRSKKDLPCYCPCCNVYFDAFKDGGFLQYPDRYNAARYMNIRQDVSCPVCGSIPRQRILGTWCEEHKELLRGKRILYFAIEHGMRLWLKRNRISVTTADLFQPADLKLDIQNMDLPDGSYDMVFCNHVLEHVDDFRLALREVHRILRPGGSLICSFPMDPTVELLDEDPNVRTDQECLQRFGQCDHLRVFGMQADRFLKESGFEVTPILGEDCSPKILPIVAPADYDMNRLFWCVKGEG